MADIRHKFSVGTAVRYSAGTYAGPAASGTYTVTRLLPPEPGDCQYRVKSLRDGHERGRARIPAHAGSAGRNLPRCRLNLWAGRPAEMGDLSGRVAIVTGAARNIGRSIAERSGAGRRQRGRQRAQLRAAAEETAQAIRAEGGAAIVHIADVTDEAGNAGAGRGGRRGVRRPRHPRQQRRHPPGSRVRRPDARGLAGGDGRDPGRRLSLHPRRPAASAALRHGQHRQYRRPVGAYRLAAPGACGAAKAGLAGLTRALAHDLGPDGITVNCVVPGLIDTVRGASATGGTPAMHSLHRTLVGRHGQPEDIAALVCYLCGPQARYLTGQTLHANGGAYLT